LAKWKPVRAMPAAKHTDSSRIRKYIVAVCMQDDSLVLTGDIIIIGRINCPLTMNNSAPLTENIGNMTDLHMKVSGCCLKCLNL
jgi:hypothetical protein